MAPQADLPAVGVLTADDGAARHRALLLLLRQSQEATARAEARATRAEAALASAEAMRAQAEQVVRITVLIRS